MTPIEVYGRPAPQGSKRHVGNGVMVESSKNVKPWRAAVKAAAIEDGRTYGKVPIVLGVQFHLGRPKSHLYRSGRVALRAPRNPITRPDLDKLIRSTLDALTDAGVYADDSCVVGVVATKTYADNRPPGATIHILTAQETP